jgi:hypothetical protein
MGSSWIRQRGRHLTDRYVGLRTGLCRFAAGGGIHDLVAPDTHHVIFVIADAAIREQKARAPSKSEIVGTARRAHNGVFGEPIARIAESQPVKTADVEGVLG